MDEILVEFKKNVEAFANEKLTQLDTKINKVEQKLNSIDLIGEGSNSLDFETELFKFEKRLCKLERQKFGYDLSTNGDGNGK